MAGMIKDPPGDGSIQRATVDLSLLLGFQKQKPEHALLAKPIVKIITLIPFIDKNAPHKALK